MQQNLIFISPVIPKPLMNGVAYEYAKVLDKAGMCGPQTGIYKWPWREIGPSDVNERIICLDEFKVGNKNAMYTEVAPGGRHSEKHRLR